MAKYSNVSAQSLLNAATKAINELSSYDLRQTIGNLSHSSNISSSAGKVSLKSLNTILTSTSVNGTIPNLKKKLLNLKAIASNIITYQKIDKEIELLKERYKRAQDPEASIIKRNIEQKERALKSYEKIIDNLLTK